jgi:hypothetical protein
LSGQRRTGAAIRPSQRPTRTDLRRWAAVLALVRWIDLGALAE